MSMRLGGGGRFAALKKKLGAEAGVTNPGALAASIGRKKYGATKFNALSQKKDMGPEKEEPGEKEDKNESKKQERAEERAEGKS